MGTEPAQETGTGTEPAQETRPGTGPGQEQEDGLEAAAGLGVTGLGSCLGMRNQAGPGPEHQSREVVRKWPRAWSLNTEGSKISPPSTNG